MISNRCILLINQLLKDDNTLTINELAHDFNVSERTIRYDLDKIDELIIKYNLSPLVRKPNVTFLNEDRNKILSLFSGELNENKPEDYYCNHEQRVDIILLELMFAKEYVTIDRLSELLMVSRSTIKNDIDDVKKRLSQRMLFLESKSKWGIKVLENELLIRRNAVEILASYIDYSDFPQIRNNNINSKNNPFIRKQIDNLFKGIDISFLENCVNVIENQLETILSDESYLNIILNLAVMILRERNDKKIKMNHSDIRRITLTRQFVVSSNVVSMIETHYKIAFELDEIIYVTELLLGSNIVKSKYVESADWYKIEIITGQLIENVSEQLNINLFLDKQLYEGLLAHILPAVYRIKNELPLKNPLLDEVKYDLSNLYDIVKESSSIIADYTGKKVTDEEIGYLTMHFGASIERMEQNALYRVNAIIVCNSGIGTAKMLSTKLERMFQINIVDVIAYHKLKKTMETKNVDLIITTIDIKETNIDTIKVSPLINEKDVENIKKHIKVSYKPHMKLNNVVNIIEKNCKIIDREQLYIDLMQYFAPGEVLAKGGEQKVLSEFLKENTIEVNVKAKDWNEAILKGGQLLYEDGCIEKSYIEAMIKVMKELGPYIVIAPGIAMPHARPESGTKKVGMSLITLDKPVNFGNDENDPVSVVICLCAIDGSTHIKALTELAELLDNEKNLELIKNASDKDVVLNVIRSLYE